MMEILLSNHDEGSSLTLSSLYDGGPSVSS